MELILFIILILKYQIWFKKQLLNITLKKLEPNKNL